MTSRTLSMVAILKVGEAEREGAGARGPVTASVFALSVLPHPLAYVIYALQYARPVYMLTQTCAEETSYY